MLQVLISDHVGDIKQVHLQRHPVTGQANYRIGYCNLATGGWSLIVQHRLKPSHIEELDELIPKVMEAYVNPDARPDPVSGRLETEDGERP